MKGENPVFQSQNTVLLSAEQSSGIIVRGKQFLKNTFPLLYPQAVLLRFFESKDLIPKAKLSISPIVRLSIRPSRKSRTSFEKRPSDFTIGLMTPPFAQTCTFGAKIGIFFDSSE